MSRARERLRVLLAQLAPADGDVAANARRVVATLHAQPDADLAVFPELFLTGYKAAAAAVDAVPDQVATVREAAAATEMAVIVGLSERGGGVGDGGAAAPGSRGGVAGAVYDAALCIDRDGSVAGVHRKACLFGSERDAFAPGERWTLVELAGCRVAPLVCFEVEFPEPARALARAGAELLVTVAANMEPYGDDHALASRARALDNRLPHVYVNRVGEEAGLRFVGGSHVVGPAGEVLAAAEPGECTLLHELELGRRPDDAVDYLRHLPAELPVWG